MLLKSDISSHYELIQNHNFNLYYENIMKYESNKLMLPINEINPYSLFHLPINTKLIINNLKERYLSECINCYTLNQLDNNKNKIIYILTKKYLSLFQSSSSSSDIHNDKKAIDFFYSHLYISKIYVNNPPVKHLIESKLSIIKPIKEYINHINDKEEEYSKLMIHFIITQPHLTYGYIERIINDFNLKENSFLDYTNDYSHFTYNNINYIPSTITIDKSIFQHYLFWIEILFGYILYDDDILYKHLDIAKNKKMKIFLLLVSYGYELQLNQYASLSFYNNGHETPLLPKSFVSLTCIILYNVL